MFYIYFYYYILYLFLLLYFIYIIFWQSKKNQILNFLFTEEEIFLRNRVMDFWKSRRSDLKFDEFEARVHLYREW